jgi:hypothetical protein
VSVASRVLAVALDEAGLPAAASLAPTGDEEEK